jgi:hypothetical protein
MTKKKPANDQKPSDRAERRQERRAADADSPYKMRSAASRRAEARARAAYRGAAPGMEGPAEFPEERIAVKDVGIRLNMDSTARPRKKAGEIDQELIIQLLHNPTKQVSTAALKEQYNYVVADIRNMALLAGGLFALLIVLAFVLPR